MNEIILNKKKMNFQIVAITVVADYRVKMKDFRNIRAEKDMEYVRIMPRIVSVGTMSKHWN